MRDCRAERFGGVFISTEQEWLEGDLGLGNVQLRNNTLVDPHVGGTHVNLMSGLPNVSCADTTFIVDGAVTTRATGC